MMRDIDNTSNDRHKFRVWDKKNNEYLDPIYYEGYYLLPSGTPCIGMTICDGIYEEYKVIPPKRLIVEPCTGLKDKNGKLIYDSDVVFDISVEAIVGWYSDRYLIKYNNGSFESLASVAKRLEVIGNIHDDRFRYLTKK